MDYEALHERVIYPLVQVRAEKAGGSGTVVYSGEHDDHYDTFVLTNHHVVKNSISVKDEWNSIIGRKVPTETRAPVEVRNYIYRDVSFLETSEVNEADIVAWDEKHDLALLHLRTTRRFPYVAKLFDPDRFRELRMGMELIACGCSLLHKPLISHGHLTSLDETVANLRYAMSSTLITFGNSGGAVFRADTLEFIGVPSMLDVAPFGFGGDPQNFLNYFIPINRIRDLVGDEWHYEFLFDPDITQEESERRRREHQDAVRRALEERFQRERAQAMGL